MNRQTATIVFMVGKIIYCYLRDLRRKSRYWHAVKAQQPPSDKWDAALDEELLALQPIMDSLKASLSQGTPNLRLKI